MPYTPHLPLIPPLVLSYNKTIHDLRAIHTVRAPTQHHHDSHGL